ncbi:hypothetical protein VPH35_032163 [Triticum aestivum]
MINHQIQHNQLNPVRRPTYRSACLPSKLRRVGEGARRGTGGRWVGGEIFQYVVLDKNKGGEGRRGTPQVAVFPNVKKDSCNSDKTIATIFFLFSLSPWLLSSR